MRRSHMKVFSELVSSVCSDVTQYASYLESQRIRVQAQHSKDDSKDESDSIFDYTVTKLKQVQSKSYFSQLQKVKSLLVDANVYEPIIINDNVNNNCRVAFFNLVKNTVTDGFCAIKNFDLFYFRLPSQGPHPAVHFIWKADPNDINVDGENTKLVVSLRGEQKTFYSRASRKIIKKMLHRIGVVKSYKQNS